MHQPLARMLTVCTHAGAVTLEHVRGMQHDERVTAAVQRMRGLSPIELRLLQLVAHQDDKGRRKGEDQCVIHGSAGPTSKAELVPCKVLQTCLTIQSLRFPSNTCHVLKCPMSHHSLQGFSCVQHGQSNIFAMLCQTLSNGRKCGQRGFMF